MYIQIGSGEDDYFPGIKVGFALKSLQPNWAPDLCAELFATTKDSDWDAGSANVCREEFPKPPIPLNKRKANSHWTAVSDLDDVDDEGESCSKKARTELALPMVGKEAEWPKDTDNLLPILILVIRFFLSFWLLYLSYVYPEMRPGYKTENPYYIAALVYA